MYSTLTKYFKEDVLFQMTNGAKGSTKTKTIANKVEDDWIDAVLEKHKTPVQLLQHLGLGKTTDNLLDRVVFDDALVSTWSRYMELFNKRSPEEKTTMLETFTIAFGDDSVTKMLQAAKRKSWARPLAAKMETEQLKMWLDSEKSVDEVFNLLRLQKSTWVSYINAFIKANPDKKDAIFSTLQSRFTDRAFNEILNEAKKYPSMESTATKIQTDKIVNHPEILKDQGVDILASLLFYAWMKYVDAFKKRNSNHHQSWFYAIRSELEYGGVQTIEKGMQNPSTIEIAKRLEREWQNFWLDQGKLPIVVFRYLSLNTAGEHVLVDQKFKRWATYLNAFNERYPDKYTTMIDGFLDNIGNRHLVQMLNAAKKDPESEKLATNLEDGLIDKWMADGLKPEELKRKFGDTSVDVVFQKLHLNKPGYPFDKPNFAVWVNYANALSAKFPEMSAISTLTKQYGDETLYNIIQRAKTRTYTKDRAIELEAAQMQHWIAMRKDPDEIFRLLQLNWEGR
ncbi:hypothetical protein PHMEG_00021071 [Phytophthora megakarya]|uniref:Avirulence (Avh) protein n=1 Tax=Phytophthora megakarya TaxID=4795 RepID=A0A225VPH5_9STRA|nr:hypothetical protein PHMEG_00021071 [Phytophthora megakarya]